jgi:uncharacterized protein (DUF4415 family)
VSYNERNNVKLEFDPLDSENPEWSSEDVANAVPFSGLPVCLRRVLSSGKRSPQKSLPKEKITVRPSPQVVTEFHAMGKGWQTKVTRPFRIG